MAEVPISIFKRLIKNIQWTQIYSREYGVQYSQMMLMSISKHAKHIIPKPSNTHIIVPQENYSAFYADKRSWDKLSKSLYKKYATSPIALRKFEKKLITNGKKYVNFGKRISRANLTQQSTQQLFVIYKQNQKILFDYTIFVATAFILNNYIADYAMTILKKYLKNNKLENKEQEIVESLFTPPKLAQSLKFQQQIKNANNLTDDQFEKLYNRYHWLSCQDIHNPPWTRTQFKTLINQLKKSEVSKNVSFNKYLKILNLKASDLELLSMAKRMVYIKDVRDDYRRQGVYYMRPLFNEIARRMKLNLEDISYLLPSEINDFLIKQTPPNLQIITQRKKGFVMYFNEKNEIVCIEGDLVKKAFSIFKIPKTKTSLHNLKGRVASQGKATGIVTIVTGVRDLHKVKNGSILVATATHPDYTIAMRRVNAIVTDEGGVTSHAAIVAREYKIPCIVGVKNATKILKNGDKIIVDAYLGIIKKIG